MPDIKEVIEKYKWLEGRVVLKKEEVANVAGDPLSRHDRLVRDIVIILQHELQPPRHLYTLVRRAAGKIAERTSGENL